MTRAGLAEPGTARSPAVAATTPTGRRPLTVIGRGRRRVLWWITPAGCLALVVPLSLGIAARLSDQDYRTFYGTPRYLTDADILLFVALAVVFAIGTLLPMLAVSPRAGRGIGALTEPELTLLGRAGTWAFRLTVLGYLLFALIGAARGATPGVLVDAVLSQNDETGTLAVLFAPVAGVTSLTQIGIAYVVIAGLQLSHGRSRTVVRRLVIVLLLGLVRSFVLTERLAVLELAVPLLVVAVTRRRQAGRGGAGLYAAPVAAVPVLLVVFGAFEYSRSWVYYRTRTSLTYPQFVVNRIAGYYATSYNNAALQVLHRPAHRLPYDTISGLWTAPGVAQLNVYGALSHGTDGAAFLNTTITQYANPEFNNPGGFGSAVADFGPAGAAVFFLVAGVLVGLAYASFRRGGPTGLLAYPVLFTGVLELPRYLYWPEGRVVPPMVFLLVLAWLLNRARDRPRSLPTAVAV